MNPNIPGEGRMKKIPVREAVGRVLCHDVTEIVPGRFKGRAFKKGHVIRAEDVNRLLDLGKESIYILDLKEGMLHEDEAAERIARAVAGTGLERSEPAEGRVNLGAEFDGWLKIDVDTLNAVNSVEDVVLGTLHTHQPVKKGRQVAGTRVIPLVVEEHNIRRVEAIAKETPPVIQVKPFRPTTVGIVTTGSEIYSGRIRDKFGPVLYEKFEELGSRVLRQVFVSDRVELTVSAIRDLVGEGAEMVAVTGGMSVDPDDQTPAAIRETGARVVTYGAPTFPGAMFMLAYLGDVPVLGLPGCVMYYRASIFDLVVPRLLAGEEVTRADVVALGHGGLCSGCADCRYPVCGFGKGAGG
jgi:molybdopterin biosynthesis enzyme